MNEILVDINELLTFMQGAHYASENETQAGLCHECIHQLQEIIKKIEVYESRSSLELRLLGCKI